MPNTYIKYSAVNAAVPKYDNFSSLPATAQSGDLGATTDTGSLYEYNGTIWQLVGPSPTVTTGDLTSSTPAVNVIGGIDAVVGTGTLLDFAFGEADGFATLDSGGKVPVSQLPSSLMEYKGAWDAATNTPTLADGVGDNGDVYRASVAGTQNLGSGPITFGVGDFAIYNGTIWQHSPAADGVSSVNGMTGAVVVDAINQLTGDVTAGPATGSQSATSTLATVNGTPGSFGSASDSLQLTVNAKGLTTTIAATPIQIAESQVTGLISDLALKAPLASPTFTGQVLVPDGTAATPGLAHTGSPTSGYYRRAANQLGFSIAGVEVGFTNGDWSLGADLNSVVTVKGRTLIGNGSSASGSQFNIFNQINDGQVIMAGGNSATDGGRIRLDGSASGGPNKVSLQVGTTDVLTSTAAGIITIPNLTASLPVFTNGTKQLVSNAVTGTGNVVMSASPTLTGTLTVNTIGSSSAPISLQTASNTRFQIDTSGRATLGNTIDNSTYFNLSYALANTSGTTQQAVLLAPTYSNSAAISNFYGIRTQLSTTAAAFTMGFMANLYSNIPTIGVGSTLTRFVNFYGVNSTAATNNAFLADNNSFTGNFFINSTSTNDSVISGQFKINTAGKGISIKEGSNAKMGVATLVAGTVTVNTTAISTTSRVFLTIQVAGGTVGVPYLGTVVNATSFVINSSSLVDTSTVAWMIVDPA